MKRRSVRKMPPSMLVHNPVSADDMGRHLTVTGEDDRQRVRSSRRPPGVPMGGNAQADNPALYILRTGNDPIGKQAFTHEHGGWPRHPVRVKDHQAYFTEGAGRDVKRPWEEEEGQAKPARPEPMELPGAAEVEGGVDVGLQNLWNEHGGLLTGGAMQVSREQWKTRVMRDLGDDLSRRVGRERLAPLADELGKRPQAPRGEANNGEFVARNLVAVWAESAADQHPWSLALQRAAADELDIGLNDDFAGLESRKIARGYYKQHGPALRAFVRAVYEHTQTMLRTAGVREVTLFRGMRWDSGERSPFDRRGREFSGPADVRLNALSSFAYNQGNAMRFAIDDKSAVLAVRVPAERVFSTPFTGPGCLSEGEVVVVGGTARALVVYIDHGRSTSDYSVGRTEEAQAELRRRLVEAARSSVKAAAAEEPAFIDGDDNADWPKATDDAFENGPRSESGRFGAGGGMTDKHDTPGSPHSHDPARSEVWEKLTPARRKKLEERRRRRAARDARDTANRDPSRHVSKLSFAHQHGGLPRHPVLAKHLQGEHDQQDHAPGTAHQEESRWIRRVRAFKAKWGDDVGIDITPADQLFRKHGMSGYVLPSGQAIHTQDSSGHDFIDQVAWPGFSELSQLWRRGVVRFAFSGGTLYAEGNRKAVGQALRRLTASMSREGREMLDVRTDFTDPGLGKRAVAKVQGISESGPEPGDAARVIVAPGLLRRVRKDISGAGGTMTGAAVSTPTAGGGLRRRRGRGV